MRSTGRFAALILTGPLALFALSPATAFAGPFGYGLFDGDGVPVPARLPPKPGEHLGEYLVADVLPVRYPVPADVREPVTAVPLPPSLMWQPDTGFGWGRRRRDEGPRQPALGELPPKPGECLGEYAVSGLPHRLNVRPDAQLPTTAVPLPAKGPEPVWIHRISWSSGRDDPPQPKFSDYPPKPGVYLGEYIAAGELPPRYHLPPAQPLPPSAVLRRPVGEPPAEDKPEPVAKKPEPANDTAIRFNGPAGLKVLRCTPDGKCDDKHAMTAPKEFTCQQGKTYRVRLKGATSAEPERAFEASVEVAPATAQTKAFLAHTSVPVAFTSDDFAHAAKGRTVVKVIYLPDPAEQDFSTVVEAQEITSTKLEAGVDPVAEAQRRGSILLVIRLSNIDPESRPAPRSNER